MSYLQLPVIDLSAADRGPQSRALLHAQLHSAAHDVGFFQLTGHGVGEAETAALTGAMRAFFALPEADRLAVSHLNSPHFRGYTRTGDERTGGSRDWRDQLDIGAERPRTSPDPASPATGGWKAPTSGPPPSRPCAPPHSAGSTGSAASRTSCCTNCSPPSARPRTSTTRSSPTGPICTSSWSATRAARATAASRASAPTRTTASSPCSTRTR